MVKAVTVIKTENGDVAYTSTGTALLDFFSSISSFRNNLEKSVQDFKEAYSEDRLYAMRLLFYLRSPRDGQGEREAFRRIISELANENYCLTFQNDIRKNLRLIPEFGRYDDLISLIEVDSLKNEVLTIISQQLKEDVSKCDKIEAICVSNNATTVEEIKNFDQHPHISLLAKWMPSVNCASKKTRNLAFKVASSLKMKHKVYRTTLSRLRSVIDVVEVKLCAKEIEDINFGAVPSYAMKKYRKAFSKSENFSEYTRNLKQGVAKINGKVLYPYELLNEVNGAKYNISQEEKVVIQYQWNALTKDDIIGEFSAIPVVDVSGSMTSLATKNCTCMDIAIAMGLIISMKSKGIFKGRMITFDSTPVWIELPCNPAEDIFAVNKALRNAPWGASTNLDKTFQMIGDLAKKSPSDMPENVVIFSDMQFNEAVTKADSATRWNKMFEKIGLKTPRLIYFNLNANRRSMPIKEITPNATIFSGFSANVFKHINSDAFTPLGQLYEILNQAPFDNINI